MVAEVLQKQNDKYTEALEIAKEAAVDSTKTEEERTQLKLNAAKEQNKMISIQTEVTKEEENKEKAKVLAEELATKEEDKKFIVELEPEEKVEIYNEIRKITFVVPVEDVK